MRIRRVVWVPALLLVVGAFAAIFGIALWRLDSFIAHNKPWLTEQAEGTLGRKLRYGDMQVSLRQGLGVRVTDIVVGEDPRYGKDDFLRVAELRVRVKLWPALFGRYHVTAVEARAPQVTIIREHSLNIDSLGLPSGEPSAKGPTELDVKHLSIVDGQLRFIDRTTKHTALVLVEDIDLEADDLSANDFLHGRVKARVNGGPELARFDGWPKELAVKGPMQLDAKVEGKVPELRVSGTLDAALVDARFGDLLHKPERHPLVVDFDLGQKGAILQIEHVQLRLGKEEVHAQGHVSLAPSAVYDVRMETKGVALEALAQLSPRLRESKPSGRASFNLRAQSTPEGVMLTGPVRVEKAHASAADGTTIDGLSGAADLHGRSGTVSLDAKTLATGPKATARDLAVRGEVELAPMRFRGSVTSASGQAGEMAYHDLTSELNASRASVVIDKLLVGVLGGQVSGVGKVELKGAQPRYAFQAQAKRIDLAARPGSGSLRGHLDAHISGTASGSTKDALMRSLSAAGTANVTDGTVRAVNLGGKVLQALSAVQWIASLASPRLGVNRGAWLSSPDTTFKAAAGEFTVHEQKLHLKDARVSALEFNLTASGSIGFDKRVDLDTVFDFSELVSTDLIAQPEVARSIFGAGKRLRVPVKVQGTYPSLSVLPDISGLKGVIEKTLVGTLGRALKVPGLEKAQSPTKVVPKEATDAVKDTVERLIKW
jgi:hypothetical protein